MYDTILILADTVESSEHDTEKTDSDNLACLLRMKDIIEKQVILPAAPGVSNEAGSSPLLVPVPAVSWAWVPAWGSLEPSRRGGENAQQTRKNGGEMGEIRLRSVGGRELTKDQLAAPERHVRGET